MLILSRKKGQKLIINDNIEVVIIEADNNLVKIGINAPKDVSVYREEIYKEVKTENKTSTSAQVDVLKEIEKEMPTLVPEQVIESFSAKIKKHEKK